MNDKEKAKQKAQVMKELRAEHKESIKRTQLLLKQNNAYQKEIRKAALEEPKTIPEIAEITGFPSHIVLWHVTAMKKYDRIKEVGPSGEYFLYQVVAEEKK